MDEAPEVDGDGVSSEKNKGERLEPNHGLSFRFLCALLLPLGFQNSWKILMLVS